MKKFIYPSIYPSAKNIDLDLKYSIQNNKIIKIQGTAKKLKELAKFQIDKLENNLPFFADKPRF